MVPPPVKEAALARGLPVYQPASLTTKEAIECLARWQPQVIVVFSFGQLLPLAVLELPPHGCLNIHPSLLPAFPGLATHRQALAAGVRVHGATVHFVSNVVDGGAIIAQAAVPVLSGDTEETLAARVLQKEHVLLPRCLRWLCEGRVALAGGRVVSRNLPPDAFSLIE